MKRKEVIQHYVQTLFTPTCVPLCWAEPAFRKCSRNEGKVRALWTRTENQELYRARIGSHKKLRLRSHGTGRIFDWTFCTHRTVWKFRSVQMGLITGLILWNLWVFYRLIMHKTLLNPERNGVQCFYCFDVFDLVRAWQVRHGLHICEIMLCNKAVILPSTAINKPARSIFASMPPRLRRTKISTFTVFTPWRSNYWLYRLKIRLRFWCSNFERLSVQSFVR